MNSAGAVRVLLACTSALSWMAVSSIIIIVNKHIMVDLDFPYPMTVSGLGMVSSSILSYITCRWLKLVDIKFEMTFGYWTRKILPVGLFMALTLWLGNLVYMHLTVAFIQMLKAFCPVITLLFLTIAGLEHPSRGMITSVLLTASGTALAAYGELNLSILGVLIMLGSETCESIRLVITQWLLTGLNCHPIEGLMYMSPAGSLFLVLGAAATEWPQIYAKNAVSVVAGHPWQFAASAFMGFTVNCLSYATIKLASSLTLKVLGTVKNTLLVVFSALFMGETVTAVSASGYAVSLLGFTWYNKIKMAQIAAGQPTGKQAQPGSSTAADSKASNGHSHNGKVANEKDEEQADEKTSLLRIEGGMSPRHAVKAGSHQQQVV